MSGNYNVSKIIDYVRGKIEVCIQKYMSFEETITNLEENHQIHRPITTSIWEKLQSENPNFFMEYYKRCEVARHIAIFNDLLSQQIDLMQKFGLLDLSTTAPAATELQKPNNDDKDEFAEWYEFTDTEETVSCIIDLSPFAATPQSDPFTSFVATPQSDPFTSFDATPLSDPCTTGLKYEIDDLDSTLQCWLDIEEQQQRLELSVHKEYDEPQHLMDTQQVYSPQENDSTTLILQQELFIKNKNLQEASNNIDFW